MFNWLKNLFFGKPAVKAEPAKPAPVSNAVFEKEAISLSEAPHVEQPKPKKKHYYKPKAKKTETQVPAPDAKSKGRKGPESK